MYRATAVLTAICAIAWCMVPPLGMASEPDHAAGETPIVPVRLDAGSLKEVALTARPPVPAHILLGGVSRPRSSVLFKSDAIVVVVFEEDPIKLALKAPGMPYDEFVHIAAGALVLTDSAGRTHEFKAGDSLLIPKGFTGTWETRAGFRELALVSRKDWDATH
jgi:uncharacterized cupin superfamily protein